jgi:ribosomal protein L9
MQSLPASELAERFEAITNSLNSDEYFIRASTHADTDVQLIDYSFEELLEFGRSLGIDTFYGVLEKGEEGKAQWARMFFFHQGIAHVQYIESEEMSIVREEESEEQVEELEQKKDLADEILETYSEILDDATEYRLENNVVSMSMERLFKLQDRLQEGKEQKEREERIDEELELEIAEAVYNDGRFHHQFNETDTEMLLQEMEVEFDDKKVRIDVVHRKAKSLLKVNQ